MERKEYAHVRGVGAGERGGRNILNNSLTKTQWMLFSFVGGLIYGYNVSLGATLQYIRDLLDLSASEEEIASASATLSDSISMIIGGHLADQFGRKSTAMLACICSIVGSLLTAFLSENYTWLLLGRLVTGIGNGLSILVIPMYIGECVTSIHRGLFVALYQLG
jgi:MFS family permease